ncbi:hypothetical protein [Kitasatospora cathayae]|uniref:Uncharacterized protein n=1 Tax=Kitasatospora cathayae TaxID=3004092 RepID=A0ABY7QA23_9ACTN|nr:hypothetical protein [Kitasatospora sp. HUAS 3-15]WBP89482.1 hypothetical protein O1G21_29025 [Kitasatospora sp. HUAS 3-15]
MNLADLAAREAVLKALADEIGDQLKAVRAEVQTELDKNRGVQQVAAVLPDGRQVAKVSLTDPAPAAVVTDPEAFAAWVRDHHPDKGAVTRRFVLEVRPATQAALLAEMTAAGVPQWCDKETGEVHTVPGVEIRATRARSHSVRFDTGGRGRVAEAWRSGALTSLVLPELTAGGAE